MKIASTKQVADAIKFEGNNSLEIHYFTGGLSCPTADSIGHSRWKEKKIVIELDTHQLTVNFGDWVVKKLDTNEISVCTQEQFDSDYVSLNDLSF